MSRPPSREKLSVPSTRNLFSVDSGQEHHQQLHQQQQQRQRQYTSPSPSPHKARSSRSASSSSFSHTRSRDASPHGGLGPSSPSSTRNSSPRSSGVTDMRSVKDEILGSIAQSALHQVKSMSLNASFVSDGVWKECKATASELIYEQKTASAFRIITKALLPCAVDEVSNVLSSEDSDQFNASMLELLGAQYAFGVTVRTLAPATPEASHLSVKAISLSSANPLSSSKRTINFLDYVESDTEQRSACRVVHTLQRTSNLDADDRQDVAGDALVGYILQEDPENKHTMAFFYATHFVKSSSGGALSSSPAALRPDTVQRFRKLAQLSTKWVDIAMRRRLGAQKILDRETDVAPTAQPQSCVVCAQSVGGGALLLLRKKHFCCLCGHFACGSCSSVEKVEARIGMVDKRRVCVDCVTRVNKQVFERETVRPWQPLEQEQEPYVHIVREGERRRDGHEASGDNDGEDASGPRYRQYTIV